MAVETDIEKLVELAVGKSWADWSMEHPGLAIALDQILIHDRIVEKLRDTPEYQKACEEYIQARIEIDFLNTVAQIINKLLPVVLGALGL
jgi:hypothetical protein